MPAPATPIRLGAPTPYITSHGSKVARLHMYDWIVLVLLAVLDGVLNIIEPFHRFVGSEMMTDLRYPMKDNTVPFWAVPVIYCSLLVFVLPCQFPWTSLLLFNHAYSDNWYHWTYAYHHCNIFQEEECIWSASCHTRYIHFLAQLAILVCSFITFSEIQLVLAGLLFSVLITAILTDAIKDGVGRPRPDFFWRCFPDGKPVKFLSFSQTLLITQLQPSCSYIT